MELNDRENDLFQALIATTKSAVSVIPGLGQAIAGWDAYHQSQFNRNVKKILEHLNDKIDNFELFFQEEWLLSDEGQQFTNKVIDASLDAQLEDKQELFVNALIHGVSNKDLEHLEKLKFIDMLRQLSRSSLMVLAEMDNMFINQVRGSGRNPDSISALPQINAELIAEKLSSQYDPYLITAAVRELESQGLFSRTGEWIKRPDGTYKAGAGFATELCYTDFAARFAEFIKEPSEHST